MVNSHTIDLSYGIRHALRALRSSLRQLGSLEEVSITTKPGRYAGGSFADEISVIFQALCCLPGLRSVSIRFDDQVLPVFVLTKMLERANDLVELGISHAQLWGDAEEFDALEQALQENLLLEDVKLVCCKIYNDTTKLKETGVHVNTRQIPRMFCRPRNLRSLWLHDCHDSHIVAVAQALQEHQTNLKELSIVSSKVGDPGVESISQMLNLDTSLEQLEVTLFKGHALRVAESVHGSSSLRKLSCNILIPQCKPTLVTDGPRRI